MEKKQKIILSVFIGAVILLVIIFVLILSSRKNNNKDNGEFIVDKESDKVVSQPVVQQQSDMNEIINTARGFVEIYFTYSNSSNFSNARELYSFMTDDFKSSVDKMISKSNNANTEYYLKTTTATSVGIQGKYNAASKNIIVSVSVIEKNMDANDKETITEKKYNVYMIKTDKWRIDDIKWKALNVEKSIFDSNL